MSGFASDRGARWWRGADRPPARCARRARPRRFPPRGPALLSRFRPRARSRSPRRGPRAGRSRATFRARGADAALFEGDDLALPVFEEELAVVAAVKGAADDVLGVRPVEVGAGPVEEEGVGRVERMCLGHDAQRRLGGGGINEPASSMLASPNTFATRGQFGTGKRRRTGLTRRRSARGVVSGADPSAAPGRARSTPRPARRQTGSWRLRAAARAGAQARPWRRRSWHAAP